MEYIAGCIGVLSVLIVLCCIVIILVDSAFGNY